MILLIYGKFPKKSTLLTNNVSTQGDSLTEITLSRLSVGSAIRTL